MTTSQPDLPDLFRQGDSAAIATLINSQLQPKGIVAKVTFNDECLQVLLESDRVLNQQALVKFIQTQLADLKMDNVQSIRVYAKKTDEDFPSWTQELEMPDGEDSSLQTGNSSIEPSISEQRTLSTTNASLKNIVSQKTSSQDETNTPRSYLIPSILVTLFAFLPIGVAALVFASQVESKHKQGDFEGAKSASSTAKILCIVGAGIAAPFYLLFISLFGFAILAPSFLNNADSARESEAKTYVGAINRGQQAFFLERNEFSSDIGELGLSITSETQNYIYTISQIDRTYAVVTATAKQRGIRSYTGAVFLTQFPNEEFATTIAEVCETNRPSTTPPQMPQLIGDTIECPSGSLAIY
jgi:hypothetical protein